MGIGCGRHGLLGNCSTPWSWNCSNASQCSHPWQNHGCAYHRGSYTLQNSTIHDQVGSYGIRLPVSQAALPTPTAATTTTSQLGCCHSPGNDWIHVSMGNTHGVGIRSVAHYGCMAHKVVDGILWDSCGLLECHGTAVQFVAETIIAFNKTKASENMDRSRKD